MFILAGYETFWKQLHTLRQVIGNESFLKALQKSSKFGLITYALSAGKLTKSLENKKYPDYNKELTDFFYEIKETIPEIDIFLDSGGYQISIGLVPLKTIPTYIESYADFLSTNLQKTIVRAFSLDVIPPDELVKNQLELTLVKQSNIDGLYFSSDFKGLLRIFHFNAFCVLQFFDQVFSQYFPEFLQRSNDYPPKLAVGGLVAFDRKQGKLFTIPYLVVALYLIRKFNLKHIQFHVLGVSSWKDILALEVLKHILRLQDITLEYTFDSSRLFKFTVRGKAVELFDTDLTLKQIVYKTSTLQQYVTLHKQRLTMKEALRKILSNFIEQEIPASEFRLYEDENDPTSKTISHWETLIMLLQSKIFVDYLKFLDSTFSQCKTSNEILNRASKIASKIVSTKSYRKFVHQLEALQGLSEASPQKLRTALLEIFRGVNRLNYFCK